MVALLPPGPPRPPSRHLFSGGEGGLPRRQRDIAPEDVGKYTPEGGAIASGRLGIGNEGRIGSRTFLSCGP
eukprot:5772400-Alexandrium_andersonii.AAC.1